MILTFKMLECKYLKSVFPSLQMVTTGSKRWTESEMHLKMVLLCHIGIYLRERETHKNTTHIGLPVK